MESNEENSPAKERLIDNNISSSSFILPNGSGIRSINDKELSSSDFRNPSLQSGRKIDEKNIPQEEFRINDPAQNIKKECYFSTEKYTVFETKERTKESKVSTKCSATYISFDSLLTNDEQYFPGHTEAEIILIRGAGDFSLNVKDEHIKQLLAKRFCCTNHRNELSLQWKLPKYGHVILDRKGSKTEPVCSMPNTLGVDHKKHRPFRVKNVVSVKESETVLKQEGILLHPGLPICEEHKNYLKTLTGDKDTPSSIEKRISDESEQYFDTEDIECREGVESVEPEHIRETRRKAEKLIHDQLKNTSEDDDDSEKKSLSSTSDADVENNMAQIDNLIAVLADYAGVSVKKERKSFDELKSETKARKVKILQKILQLLAERMSPSNPTSLIKMVCTKEANDDQNAKKEKSIDVLFGYVREQYRNAKTVTEKIDVLSQIVKGMKLETLKTYIPEVSRYQFNTASFLASRKLTEWNVEPTKQVRINCDLEIVCMFARFLASPAITVSLPYGTQTATLPDGRKFDIPSTVRKQRDAEIIRMFYAFLRELGFTDPKISESMLRKILHVCAAHRQKSLHCVDYYEAAGKKGFDKLLRCLEKIHQKNMIDSTTKKRLKLMLQDSRLYISTDYPRHIKMFSREPEHCINFGLSDPENEEFCGLPCAELEEEHRHTHDLQCDRCPLFKEAIKELRKITEELLEDNEDVEMLNNMIEEINKCEYDIQQWKYHVMRAVFSELKRVEIIESLEDGEALLTLDYCQKYLPRKYYETQKDYFGRRGKSWHIINITARIDGKIVQHTIVHLMGYEEQSSKAVYAIVHDAVEKCKAWKLTALTLRMDNASYYRNAALLHSIMKISEEFDMIIKRVSFSEVQAGKSSADRDGARLKIQLQFALNEKIDIMTEDDMYVAINHGTKRISSLTAVLASVDYGKNEKDDFKIPNISLISDIEYNYTERKLVLWKHYKIGKGKVMDVSKSTMSSALNIKKQTEETPDTEEYLFWRTKNSIVEKQTKKKATEETSVGASDVETEDENQDSVIDADNDIKFKPNALFPCPVDNCIKMYIKYGNLERHLEKWKHVYAPVKITPYDYALNSYADCLEQLKEDMNEMILTISIEEMISRENFNISKGHSLRQLPKRKRFTAEQHSFVEEYVEKCLANKKWCDPQVCETEMEEARNTNRSRRFSPAECLSFNQLSSLITRKIKQKQKTGRSSQKKQKAKEREEIDVDIENQTGETEIEYQDEPFFSNETDILHEYIREEQAATKENETAPSPKTKKRIRENSPKKADPVTKRKK